MGDPYVSLLDACQAAIGHNVTRNIFERHIVPFFLVGEPSQS
jgi:hypothetical protein